MNVNIYAILIWYVNFFQNVSGYQEGQDCGGIVIFENWIWRTCDPGGYSLVSLSYDSRTASKPAQDIELPERMGCQDLAVFSVEGSDHFNPQSTLGIHRKCQMEQASLCNIIY